MATTTFFSDRCGCLAVWLGQPEFIVSYYGGNVIMSATSIVVDCNTLSHSCIIWRGDPPTHRIGNDDVVLLLDGCLKSGTTCVQVLDVSCPISCFRYQLNGARWPNEAKV